MQAKRVLVFRFSAMGDVAMCVPVVAQFCKQFPDVQVIFVTRKHFKALFPALPNLFIHPIFPESHHKGMRGLFKLFIELRGFKPTHIADLHQNLRTKTLKFFFFFTKTKVKSLNKGRSERRKLLKEKKLTHTKPMYERYQEVFVQLGFSLHFNPQQFLNKRVLDQRLKNLFPCLNSKEDKWIGVFPFAQHAQKVYPQDKMLKVLEQLSNQNFQIFLFGFGAKENAIVQTWIQNVSNIHNTINQVSLDLELQLISNLDVMLSMDTSGMHMASLYGVPVVSVWGATHPAAGFLGIGQDIENCVQIDLTCRPCSIYGNKECARGDLACLQMLSPENIVQKLLQVSGS